MRREIVECLMKAACEQVVDSDGRLRMLAEFYLILHPSMFPRTARAI